MKFIITKTPNGEYADITGNRFGISEVKPGTIALGPGVQEAAGLAAAATARGLVLWTPPFDMSKLVLLEALAAAGLEEAVMARIEGDLILKRRWDAATVLSTDNPLVVSLVAWGTQTLGLTAAQVQALFQAARI